MLNEGCCGAIKALTEILKKRNGNFVVSLGDLRQVDYGLTHAFLVK